MEKTWYETLGLLKLVPNFNPKEAFLITDFHYYEDYDNAFEKISFLEMSFHSESEEERFEVTLKFINISSLELMGFGNAYNQLSGFYIRDLKESRFEKECRYLVEDYEGDILNFYCESIEIVEVKN